MIYLLIFAINMISNQFGWASTTIGQQSPMVVETTSHKAIDRLKTIDLPIFAAYSSSEKIYIILYTPNRTDSTGRLILAEATKDTLKRYDFPSWKVWITSGMPSALQKIDLLIDTQNSTLFPENGIENSSSNHLFQLLEKLLTQKMTPIHPEKRKKQGSLSHPNDIDRRPIWNPPVVIDGKVSQSIPSDAFTLVIQQKEEGESQLPCILYYAIKSSTLLPPFIAFPTWIESAGRQFFTARLIDSGTLVSTENNRDILGASSSSNSSEKSDL